MLAKEITSLQHPIVKRAFLLRQSKKERRKEGLVLVSGSKQIQEISSSVVLFVQKGKKIPDISVPEIYVVTEEILKKITGVCAPEPLAALVPLPQQKSLQGARRILGLNGINDPGNLGTLLRTALALGWEGAFLTEGCVDPFNDKALRAAKGATFSLPLREGSIEELCRLAEEEAMTVFVADAQGISIEDPSLKKGKETNLLLILGNEANGPDAELKEKFKILSVPIGNMDSLNVATAGAILMYELRKRQT